MNWRAGSLDEAIERWDLVPDGAVQRTASSHLMPVQHRGRPAMLKVPLVEEEAIGGLLLAAWNGAGTAAVFEVDDQAVVLERATSGRDLSTLTRSGDDPAAVRILCSVMRTLHALPAPGLPPSGLRPSGLPSLDRWFQDLTDGDDTDPALRQLDPASAAFLARARPAAARMLAETTLADTVVLHGDLHHENVLEFAAGDWRAIDPKGIVGHRAFDATALFTNPDPVSATDAARFGQRVDLVTGLTGVTSPVLLDWVVARSALSAIWSAQGGDLVAADLAITVGLLAEQARCTERGGESSTATIVRNERDR